MKQEILDYYESLNIPLRRMINIGVTKKNLTAAAVKAAAIEVYEERQAGTLTVPDLRIAWEVFARAKNVKIDADAKENNLIKELRKEIVYLKLPWWKKMMRRMKS